MCTVSYIARKNGSFITSNRDEHISRPIALQPAEELINGVKILFPKDPKAGGTWFALNEFGAVGVLLNGAFKNHRRKLPYAKSRGLILLDIMASENPVNSLYQMEFTGIEPFTLVLFHQKKLMEFRWDGAQHYSKELESDQDYIWSSVTLYDKDAIQHRETLFDAFVKAHKTVTGSQIMDFHSNNHEDYQNGFIIDRKTGLKTFSVTQVALMEQDIALHHYDLMNKEEYHLPFSPRELTPAK
nr:NRDE family protein [Allomuricauda sp.]